MFGGDLLIVSTPDGELELEVVIPEGVTPGEPFEIQPDPSLSAEDGGAAAALAAAAAAERCGIQLSVYPVCCFEIFDEPFDLTSLRLQ